MYIITSSRYKIKRYNRMKEYILNLQVINAHFAYFEEENETNHSNNNGRINRS